MSLPKPQASSPKPCFLKPWLGSPCLPVPPSPGLPVAVSALSALPPALSPGPPVPRSPCPTPAPPARRPCHSGTAPYPSSPPVCQYGSLPLLMAFAPLPQTVIYWALAATNHNISHVGVLVRRLLTYPRACCLSALVSFCTSKRSESIEPERRSSDGQTVSLP
jgi:hypothetical protein